MMRGGVVCYVVLCSVVGVVLFVVALLSVVCYVLSRVVLCRARVVHVVSWCFMLWRVGLCCVLVGRAVLCCLWCVVPCCVVVR